MYTIPAVGILDCWDVEEEDPGLNREEDEDEDQSQDKEAQKSSFGGAACGEYACERGSESMEPVDYEAWLTVSGCSGCFEIMGHLQQ